MSTTSSSKVNNYTFCGGYALPIVQKIALSGLFIALACILNKVLAINYISAVPFVRISFGGPAIIMFSAFLLGPFYGAFVGAMQDILGYFIFDIKAFPWYPSITSTYLLLGFCSGLLFYVLHKVKSKRLTQIITYLVMFLSFIGLSCFLIFNNEVSWWGNTHTISLWMKIVFPLAMFILLAILIGFIELSNKKGKFNDLPLNIYQLTLGCFIIEVLIMTLYGSLMKSVAFGMDIFLVILFCQSMTMFFNIPFNVILISFIMKSTKRYYVTSKED